MEYTASKGMAIICKKTKTVLWFSFFAFICRGLVLEWDSEVEPWEDFHIRHCGMVCNNGTFLNLNKYKCPNPRCFKCDCHPDCSVLDTCCPHGLLQPNKTFIRETRERTTFQTPPPYPEQIECTPVPFNTYNHLQVVRCPPGYGDASLKNSVQTQILEHCTQEGYKAPDLLSFLAYIDVESGLLFKNKYCALCNGYKIRDNNNFSKATTVEREGFDMKVAEPWPLQVKCSHYQELYTLTSPLDFIKAAHTKLRTSLCNVFYTKPPSQLIPRWCFQNTSEKYDNYYTCTEPVLSLCRNLNHTYLTVMRHKNLFCAMCSGINPAHLSYSHCKKGLRLWAILEETKGRIPPLSLLLEGYKNHNSFGFEQNKNCSIKPEWMNDKGKCQPALCAPGKVINETGECVSAIDQIRGLGYKVFLVLRPVHTLNLSSEDVQSLANDIGTGILGLAKEGDLQINLTVSCSSARLEDISVSAFLAGNESLRRDEYERVLVEYLTKNWTLKIQGNTTDVTLKPLMLGAGFEPFVREKTTARGCIISLPTIFIRTHVFTFYLPYEQLTPQKVETVSTSLCKFNKSDVCLKENNTLVLSQTFSSIPQLFAPDLIWRFRDKFIDVTYSLNCPYVKMNISKVTHRKDFVNVEFIYFERTFSVNSTESISLVDGALQICIDTFKNITSPTINVIISKRSTIELVQYYLEITCLSLSVICLSVSAITYCLFRSLRSLPGVNNLSLCVSLAVAQICLILTVQLGVNGKLPPRYCLAHAVLLHYSWLAAFAWMNICCIHMFRVFRTHDTKFLDSSSDGKRFRAYCMFGYGLPALIVLTTYAINAGVSNGVRNGYRDDVCFLDNRKSVWTVVLALLTPLCLVMLSNGVMFVLTIIEIASVSRVQGNSMNNQRQGVVIYAKLSTLTGLLGAITVLAIQLDIDILSLLTAPLMALQGVFIFFSFICNNKVRLLYFDLLRKCGIPCQSSKAQERVSKPTESTSYSRVPSSSSNNKTTVTTCI